MKTHKGAAKRVKISGTGKYLMNTHGRNNKRMKKRSTKLYAIRGLEVVDSTHRRRLQMLLPYGK